ncbi:MAG: hypothetical protein Q8P41_09470 [Pseudomonadota bacterium]|nr:hypothetical protein [Pseudomonadota bacterium]
MIVLLFAATLAAEPAVTLGAEPGAGLPTGALVLPSAAFTLPIVEGEAVTRGGADRGLVTVKSAAVDQNLSWEPVVGDMEATARHELGLVRRASAQSGTSTATEGTLTETEVAGRRALTWQARVDNTLFLGTTFDCPDARVVLVSFGSTNAHVRRAHGRSLAGAVCAASAAAAPTPWGPS